MYFDLNFGRLFGVKIDSCRKAESSANALPQEICIPKKRDFPQGKRYFFKIDIFVLKWKSIKKPEKTTRKIASKSMSVWTSIF